MRLQRIAVYRATRVLSWVLPVVIVVFVGIAVWSYTSRSHDTGPDLAVTPELPRGIAVVTKDVKYVVSVSGKDQFQVHAEEMQVSRENRSLLKGVEVVIYARKPGDPDRRIQGDECTHDKATQQVDCRRNVSVELEPGTFARTEQLSYEAAGGLISSGVPTALDRAGEMTGNAGKMDYLVETGLMHLTDGFVIEMNEGGGTMRGGIGVFQYREDWATVSNGVELTSGDVRIVGGSGRAELSPGTYRARKITVEGRAAAEAPSFVVSSDWLSADLSEAGAIDHVLGRGNVHAEHRVADGTGSGRSGEDGLHGSLNGPEVEAWLTSGRVMAIEARQHPDFSSKSGTLKAEEKIRIEPSDSESGSLRTEGRSTFTGEGLPVVIDGRDFLIRVQGDEQIFNTASRATLRSSGMTTVADRTEARLNTKTNTLTDMEQSGKVTFEEEGGRRGAAGKLIVRNGGEWMELEGDKPWFKVAEGTLYARKITFDRETGSFSGDGNVQMVSSGTDGKPIVVNAGHAEGNADRMAYTGNVQMYPGDGKIEADQLTLYPKENRFEAGGKVHSQVLGLEVWSGTLDFRDSGQNRQIAHYTGDVRAEKKDKDGILELRGQDLNVHLRNGEKGGELERIVATGRVEMAQGTRDGRGDRFEYNLATQETLLVGTKASEAEVHERGTEQFVKGCSILVMADGSKTVKTCSGGVVTSSFKGKN